MRDLVDKAPKWVRKYRRYAILESPYSGDLYTTWKGKRLLRRSAILHPSGHYRITEVYKDDATGLAVTITLDNMEAPNGNTRTEDRQGP